MTANTADALEFAPHFRARMIWPGDDDALMRRAFALRFEVYCQECRFLPSADYPDRLETDAQDADSAHFCAFNAKDELVGYVRLVRPDAELRFPFQSHCAELHAGVELPRPAESAEISRLMVRQDYRRRRGDLLAGVTVGGSAGALELDRRGRSPQLLLSLYRQMYLFSLANDIRYWYAAMESFLAQALAEMHFAFDQVGPQTDYYGPVAPYLADLRELEARVGMHNPLLMAWLRQPGPGGR